MVTGTIPIPPPTEPLVDKDGAIKELWYRYLNRLSAATAGSTTVTSDGDYFNVLDYGATGNGIDNDTPWIQAAIDAAFNNGGGIVYLPAGTYLTTSVVNVQEGVSIQGDGPSATTLHGNHAGIILKYDDISTQGMHLRDMEILGNNSSGSSFGNGTSTAIYLASSAEETAHFLMSNLRIYGHAKGVDSSDTFSMFDGLIEKVDFLQCATWGYKLSGSQNILQYASFRLCNTGIEVTAESAFSVGGATLTGPLFVANVVDFNINNAYIRPIRIYGGWFEQTKTTSFRNGVGGEVFFVSLVVEGCLFQPAATATNTGIFDVVDCKGSVEFNTCCAFYDLYASAAFGNPNDANCMYRLLGSYRFDGGSTVQMYSNIIGADVLASNGTVSAIVRASSSGVGEFGTITNHTVSFLANNASVGSYGSTNWFISGAKISTESISPSTNDGLTLGTSALKFADLYLANGAVIDFSTGNATITHSAANLSIQASTVTVASAAISTAAIYPTTAGGMTLGTSGNPFSAVHFLGTQTDNASPNALDDYEEGVFTPSLTAASGAFGGVGYNSAGTTGGYTKIGNMVAFHSVMQITTLSSGTASGQVRISGLPFATTRDTAVNVGYSASWGKNPTSALVTGQVINLYYKTATTADSAGLTVADITTGSQLVYVAGTYRV